MKQQDRLLKNSSVYTAVSVLNQFPNRLLSLLALPSSIVPDTMAGNNWSLLVGFKMSPGELGRCGSVGKVLAAYA